MFLRISEITVIVMRLNNILGYIAELQTRLNCTTTLRSTKHKTSRTTLNLGLKWFTNTTWRMRGHSRLRKPRYTSCGPTRPLKVRFPIIFSIIVDNFLSSVTLFIPEGEGGGGHYGSNASVQCIYIHLIITICVISSM